MPASYILIICFLFLLSISLLTVGVSNDAVNFLNSAIGSRVASFSVIMAVAAAGVLVGDLGRICRYRNSLLHIIQPCSSDQDSEADKKWDQVQGDLHRGAV